MAGIPIHSAVAPRDIAIETCIGLGAVWRVRGRVIPPIAAGHLVCFDLTNSPLLPGGDPEVTEHDVVTALAFLLEGKASAQALFDSMYDDGEALVGMQDRARKVLGAYWEDTARTIIASLEHALGGFQCVHWGPDAGASGGAVPFDISWLGQLIGSVTQSCPALTPDDVTWNIPLALAAHLRAATAGRNGAQIHRPYDIERAKREAEQMVKDGSI